MISTQERDAGSSVAGSPLLADRELIDETEDRLDYDAYADALAAIIDNERTDTPLTIAISGPWGAGKTSLAKMVAARLDRERRKRPPQHIACWFHAWLHDDAPHLGAAFAGEVARTAAKARPRWLRIVSPLPTAMLSPEGRWRRRALLLGSGIVVAVGLALLVPGTRLLFVDKDAASDLRNAIGGRSGALTVLAVGMVGLFGKVFSVGRAAARFVRAPGSEAARGSMDDVKEQLGRIVRQATRIRKPIIVRGRVIRRGRLERRRLIIFVDDLERCRPPRAVDVCEIASQLLGHQGVVTVLLGDMGVVANSATQKYRPAEQQPRADDGEYGRLYLEKMVQIKFDLPAPLRQQMESMISAAETGQPSGQLTSVEESLWTRMKMGRRLRDLSPKLIGSVAAALLVATSTTVAARDVFVSSALEPAAFIFVAVLIGVGKAVYDTIQERRAEEAVKQIDVQIKAEVKEGVGSPDELEAKVLRSVSAKERPSVSGRVTHFVTDEGEWRKEAEGEVMSFLPPLPRSAKRMMNHLRLLLAIARGRRMVGGSPPLTPKHLGRWIVLLERWPELAAASSRAPRLLRELEGLRTLDELSDALEKHGLRTPPSPDLLKFLRRGPLLSRVVDRLVYLQPASA